MTFNQKYLHTQHKLRHITLYDSLRELIDDWCSHTGNYEKYHTVAELLDWAREQSQEPTEHPVSENYNG